TSPTGSRAELVRMALRVATPTERAADDHGALRRGLRRWDGYPCGDLHAPGRGAGPRTHRGRRPRTRLSNQNTETGCRESSVVGEGARSRGWRSRMNQTLGQQATAEAAEVEVAPVVAEALDDAIE